MPLSYSIRSVSLLIKCYVGGQLSSFRFETGHQAQKRRLGKFGAGKFAGDVALTQNDNASAQVHDLGKFRGDHKKSQTLAGEFVQEMMNFGLRAHIDATRWFVDNENCAFAGQPFGESDFL